MAEYSPAEQTKTAKALLKLSDPKVRKRSFVWHIVVLTACIYAHSASRRWDSPLSLMPEMFTAIIMGFTSFSIPSLRRFPLLQKYLDWKSIEEDAEPGDQPDTKGTG